MMPTSLLPALITAVIVLIVASVVAGLALFWTSEPRARQTIGRLWIVVVIFTVLGLAIFWIASAMVGHGVVDRGMQQQQQHELEKRLEKGGH